MHIEPPGPAARTLRDFAAHYLMIVLGILTALGLEQAIEYSRDREGAREAQAQIEAELRTNLQDIGDAMRENESHLQTLRPVAAALAADLRTGMPLESLRHKISDEYRKRLVIGVMFPPFNHDAWDVAVASQSASHIPVRRLQAYTAAYTAERDTLEAMKLTVSAIYGPRMPDVLAATDLGIVDPHEFYFVIQQLIVAGAAAQSALGQTKAEVMKDLTTIGAAPPAGDHEAPAGSASGAP